MRCEEDNELEEVICIIVVAVAGWVSNFSRSLALPPHAYTQHLFFHFMFSGVFTNELLLLLVLFFLHQAYALEFSLSTLLCSKNALSLSHSCVCMDTFQKIYS